MFVFPLVFAPLLNFTPRIYIKLFLIADGMSYITKSGGPLDFRHLGKQAVVGVVVGASAGYAEKESYCNVALGILAILVAATALDHLGYLNTPWGYRGPGKNNHALGGLTVQKGFFLIIDFPVRNGVLFLCTLVSYNLMTGRSALQIKR